ncbi:MAG: P-type conjugative transfer protein VirB9 [Wolbachia endosymbiont of Fragariocoptes setiger]|nr:P-type conjugative transfer protein VirB9 [Wolbachia endosymbiont of Fragariocoptes setiger]
MNTYRILLIFTLMISTLASASTNYNNPISIDSRIKTFVYSSNEVFTVVFSQGYYSYIEFAEGEKVKNIAMGDASSWKVSHSDNKLFIMPFEVSSRTNMIITTTKKRNYIFDLISRPNYDKEKEVDSGKKVVNGYSAERDISYIVRFYYPKTENEFDVELDELSTPTQMQYVDQTERIIESNDTQYNYTYVTDSQNEDIIPIELFDDGYLTYLKFRDNTKIPQIFVERKDRTRLFCKRLLFDGYVIIKGVHKRLFMNYKNNEVEIINRSL